MRKKLELRSNPSIVNDRHLDDTAFSEKANS